eukprot:scaffold11005_cov25-Tisochrysis_lutea.AAC.8
MRCIRVLLSVRLISRALKAGLSKRVVRHRSAPTSDCAGGEARGKLSPRLDDARYLFSTEAPSHLSVRFFDCLQCRMTQPLGGRGGLGSSHLLEETRASISCDRTMTPPTIFE